MTKGTARARCTRGLLLCVLAIAAISGCNNDGSTSSSVTSAGLGIAGSPATQAVIGQLYSFTPTVTGATAPTAVGFSIQNKPMWATFNTSTGQLEGKPATENVGNYPNIVISASTGSTQASLAGFTITVAKTGTVTLNWQAPTKNTDGTALNDIAGYTIHYGTSAGHLTESASVDTPSTHYTLQNLSPGVWYFTVTAYTTSGVQGNPSAAANTTIG